MDRPLLLQNSGPNMSGLLSVIFSGVIYVSRPGRLCVSRATRRHQAVPPHWNGAPSSSTGRNFSIRPAACIVLFETLTAIPHSNSTVALTPHFTLLFCLASPRRSQQFLRSCHSSAQKNPKFMEHIGMWTAVFIQVYHYSLS